MSGWCHVVATTRPLPHPPFDGVIIVLLPMLHTTNGRRSRLCRGHTVCRLCLCAGLRVRGEAAATGLFESSPGASLLLLRPQLRVLQGTRVPCCACRAAAAPLAQRRRHRWWPGQRGSAPINKCTPWLAVWVWGLRVCVIHLLCACVQLGRASSCAYSTVHPHALACQDWARKGG